MIPTSVPPTTTVMPCGVGTKILPVIGSGWVLLVNALIIPGSSSETPQAQEQSHQATAKETGCRFSSQETDGEDSGSLGKVSQPEIGTDVGQCQLDQSQRHLLHD